MAIDRVPFEQKRTILQHVFGGKDVAGMRLGVYVEKAEDGEKKWFFSLRGHFWNWDNMELEVLEKWQRIRGSENRQTRFTMS